MTNNLLDRSIYFIATATLCSFAFAEHIPIPSRIHALKPKSDSKYFYEDVMNNPYYSLKKRESEALQQIEIMHKFVSEILLNSEDLDPLIGKIVNKNFWKLI
jgi:transcription termination factor NusB